MAEEHLRLHPEDKEVLVCQTEDHRYVLTNELVRLHYERKGDEWVLRPEFVCGK